MKKTMLLFTAGVFFASFGYAQDDAAAEVYTNKNGDAILPASGDWAIGFDAAPFLNYAGNLLNSGATSPTADWISTQEITGKMFVDANTAYRVKLRLGFGNMSITNKISDDKAEYDALQAGNLVVDDVVDDTYKGSYNAIGIGAGIEKRRGNGRIQGIYGGEAMISLSGGSTEYTYGNDFSNDYATNSTDWSMITGDVNQIGGERVLEDNPGGTFGLSIRGFIGVEMFVFPKVSIAAEYGWGLGMASTGDGTSKTEEWGMTNTSATANTKIEHEYATGGGSVFGIDTDNNGGQLRIMFHF
jgi:hypothetical protein